ncbi:hypothetical protein M8J76_001800 [Diaphorina citri]|nr:hypothetical protein M8J76_001800 [Diaphorina citri]
MLTTRLFPGASKPHTHPSPSARNTLLPPSAKKIKPPLTEEEDFKQLLLHRIIRDDAKNVEFKMGQFFGKVSFNPGGRGVGSIPPEARI